MITYLATALSKTRVGRKALAKEADLASLRGFPSPRVLAGLALIAASFAMGAAIFWVGGGLFFSGESPWLPSLIAVGLLALSHLAFAAGMWLGGGGYAGVLAHWAARRFLLGYAEPEI